MLLFAKLVFLFFYSALIFKNRSSVAFFLQHALYEDAAVRLPMGTTHPHGSVSLGGEEARCVRSLPPWRYYDATRRGGTPHGLNYTECLERVPRTGLLGCQSVCVASSCFLLPLT